MAIQSPGASTPNESAPQPKSKGSRSLIEWIVVLGAAIVVALLVKTFLIQAFYIPSASMHPTLLENDRVLVNKLSYKLHDINRGDIVVFEQPTSTLSPEVTRDLIKRVVGLPGESIAFDNNKVFINGQPLDEPYLAPGTVTGQGKIQCTLEKPCKIPSNEIFVMGDNRTNSSDSRYIGTISKDLIVGRAFTRVWPLNRLGGL